MHSHRFYLDKMKGSKIYFDTEANHNNCDQSVRVQLRLISLLAMKPLHLSAKLCKQSIIKKTENLRHVNRDYYTLFKDTHEEKAP